MADTNLPDEIVEAIAISNAKAIGEQPAILANLALANQILNNNLQQQLIISQQQAMNQITLATVAKSVSLIISSGDGGDANMVKDIMNAMQVALGQQTNPSQDVENGGENGGENDPSARATRVRSSSPKSKK